MTHLTECNAIQDIVELLAHDGFDSLGEAVRLERQHHLGVGPYEQK
ncbi:hypothetical protein [Pelovirga terrestris]|uniref:Uncharacterized protein n=1 Tax=Pelovirga terrestris TaxID=2771352 RepID=A0A8J6UL14_9BACT|nr:hypothetical protein [Pelovirga terrestris]MBD1400382.1 hypothetical protein [Pelovirga terrestris]